LSSNIQIPKNCEFCGKAYIAKTTVTRFCSHKCSQRAYKARAREEKVQKSIESKLASISKPDAKRIINPLNSIQLKEFLSINEVSDLLGVSRWTIQRMVQRGQLSVKQIGRKKIMSRQQVDDFFKS
jgi:excisionase family DNA binding protein